MGWCFPVRRLTCLFFTHCHLSTHLDRQQAEERARVRLAPPGAFPRTLHRGASSTTDGGGYGG